MRQRPIRVADRCYWFTMAAASICGANGGDILVDELALSPADALVALSVAATVVLLVGRLVDWRSNSLFWVSIIVVRMAATVLADQLAAATEGHALASSLIALVLAVILIVRDEVLASGSRPATDGVFWFAMLTAGLLGTLIGDGVAHAIVPKTTGVPIAALLGSGVLAILHRARRILPQSALYWVSVVAMRAWGTTVGDITGFLTSRPASMAGTLLVVALLVHGPSGNQSRRHSQPVR